MQPAESLTRAAVSVCFAARFNGHFVKKVHFFCRPSWSAVFSLQRLHIQTWLGNPVWSSKSTSSQPVSLLFLLLKLCPLILKLRHPKHKFYIHIFQVSSTSAVALNVNFLRTAENHFLLMSPTLSGFTVWYVCRLKLLRSLLVSFPPPVHVLSITIALDLQLAFITSLQAAVCVVNAALNGVLILPVKHTEIKFIFSHFIEHKQASVLVRYNTTESTKTQTESKIMKRKEASQKDKESRILKRRPVCFYCF